MGSSIDWARRESWVSLKRTTLFFFGSRSTNIHHHQPPVRPILDKPSPERGRKKAPPRQQRHGNPERPLPSSTPPAAPSANRPCSPRNTRDGECEDGWSRGPTAKETRKREDMNVTHPPTDPPESFLGAARLLPGTGATSAPLTAYRRCGPGLAVPLCLLYSRAGARSTAPAPASASMLLGLCLSAPLFIGRVKDGRATRP